MGWETLHNLESKIKKDSKKNFLRDFEREMHGKLFVCVYFNIKRDSSLFIIWS